MKVVRLNEGETYQPDPGWKRVSLAGSPLVSIEYFEKPPHHASPLHQHEQEQVCVVLKGRMRATGGNDIAVDLDPGDSVWFAAHESHRIENLGQETAIGLDIFAPARSFSFWKDRPVST